MYGPQAAFFSELFGTRVRYSGASLGYQLASVLAGGFAPLIAVALLAAYGYGAVAAYMAAMALLTTVSVILAAETYRAISTRTNPKNAGSSPSAAAVPPPPSRENKPAFGRGGDRAPSPPEAPCAPPRRAARQRRDDG
jgi:hypothetical protein